MSLQACLLVRVILNSLPLVWMLLNGDSVGRGLLEREEMDLRQTERNIAGE